MSESKRPLIPMIISSPQFQTTVKLSSNPSVLSPFRASFKVKSTGNPNQCSQKYITSLPPIERQNQSYERTPQKKKVHLSKSMAGLPTLKSYLPFAFQSLKGKNGIKPKTHNQDHYFISEDRRLFGICDGHGPSGHLVSSYLSSQLPQLLSSHSWSNAIELCELKLSEDIDLKFSGSTLNAVQFTPTSATCCNVGDSRAILARLKAHKWSCIPLSRDHKPGDMSEKKRIEQCGGKVEPSNKGGPPRVWLKNIAVPGLAMSRSIGDEIATSVGVISTPEVKEFPLKSFDKFSVIASDGIWEVLSPYEAVCLAVEGWIKGNPHVSCDSIVAEATRRWKTVNYCDDITVIVVFLRNS